MSLVQKKASPFEGDAVVNGEFKKISLADYKGKWVVLFFYPLDFTFVCPTEITAFSDRAGEFRKLNAEIIACSVDSKFSHLAWTEKPRNEGGLGKIAYPILSDLNKTIATHYGVLIEGAGVALRGLFIINPEGAIAYEVIHDLPVGRNVDEVLRVLEALQTVGKTGQVCPAGWKSGGKTMVPDTQKSKEYFKNVN